MFSTINSVRSAFTTMKALPEYQAFKFWGQMGKREAKKEESEKISSLLAP